MMKTYTISELKQLSDKAYLLSIDWQPDFTSGQMVSLQLNPTRPPRLYSIASKPGSPTLDVLFTVVENGELTPSLAECRAGDQIWAGEPAGEFLDRGQDAVYISNGSGIAPFMSMFRSGIRNRRILVHGSRFESDLYFSAELTAADTRRHEAGETSKENPDSTDFHYIPCLSSGETAEQNPELARLIRPYRLTVWLEDQLGALSRQLEQENIQDNSPAAQDTLRLTDRGESLLLRKNQLYYLCGSEAMVIQVRQMLISAGIDYWHIISEIYF